MAMMKNRIIRIRLNNFKEKQEVLQSGIYHFDSEPLIVKSQTTEIDFSKKQLLLVPIQIKLPRLEFKQWSAKGLRKINSLLGRSLKMDKNTEQKIGLCFAILYVKVHIGKPLLERMNFMNERGLVVKHQVNISGIL